MSCLPNNYNNPSGERRKDTKGHTTAPLHTSYEEGNCSFANSTTMRERDETIMIIISLQSRVIEIQYHRKYGIPLIQDRHNNNAIDSRLVNTISMQSRIGFCKNEIHDEILPFKRKKETYNTSVL